MPFIARLATLWIEGYGPFREMRADLQHLEVLVGANGTGKSSLFEFLRLVRDGLHDDIPPEIVRGSSGRQVFHVPGDEHLGWGLSIELGAEVRLRYVAALGGPVGRPHVGAEQVFRYVTPDKRAPILEVQAGRGFADESHGGVTGERRSLALDRPNQVALATVTDPAMGDLYLLRQYVRGWRFYDSFRLASEKIRQPVFVQQAPVLHEDGGNLSAVLHYLMTEHEGLFTELQHHLRAVIPGFGGLTVKARGAPGQVIAFWREVGQGPDDELSLADLSDGTLRFICWAVLCLHPTPPPLVCVDEPDQGVHPRALALLAGLFRVASEKTQIILATHSSYFLAQFKIENIAVLRKEGGAAVFVKPSNSAVLRDMLEEFGPEEIQALHQSDEIEILA